MPDKISEGVSLATEWSGNLATLLKEEEVFDPALGSSWRQEWVGTKAQIDGKRAVAIASGWRTTRHVESDQHYLTITTPDPVLIGGEPASEVPVDVYELSTEYEVAEIWTNPLIVEQTYKANALDQATVISAYKRFCSSRLRDLYMINVTGGSYLTFAAELAAVQDGTIDKRVARGMGPTPLSELGLDTAAAQAEFNFGDGGGVNRCAALLEIYKQMLMGLESWEVRRVVLSRRRTCSAQYAAKHIVDGVEKVYTTAALIQLFALPNTGNEIGQRLPDNPATTPPGTAWAWKIRRQDSQQLRGTARVEEVLDFVFAAWSLSIYELVTAPP